jgi:hypothetical protein
MIVFRQLSGTSRHVVLREMMVSGRDEKNKKK